MTQLCASDVRVSLDGVLSLVEPVDFWFLWRPQLRGAGDELVLEVAANGRAEAIVTFNRRDFEPATRLFGVDLWKPSQALKKLRA